MKKDSVVMLNIMLMCSLLYMGQGWAGSWQQAVTAKVSTEYETNPALNPNYDGGIWKLLLEPGYSLTGTYDTDEFKAGLGALLARASDSELIQDRNDPSVLLGWQHQGETDGLGVNARYDEVATRSAEFDGVGIVFADGTRATRGLSAVWNRSLSERTTLALDGAYSSVLYKGGTYTDYVSRSGGLTLRYDWSESSAPFVKIAYVDYAPTGDGQVEHRNSATLGLNQKLSGQLDTTVQAGQSRGGTDDSITSQGGAVLRYAGQTNRWLINAERSVAPSGLGSFVTADQVNASWSNDTSESNHIGVDLLWRRSHLSVDYLYRTAGAWLQHDLTFFWGMRLYGLRKVSGGDEISSAASNVLGLSFTYTDPNF